MTAVTYETMSASDHSAQLRKAVVAATIGTTIEWYDFFLYGTAAGLIFGKLYFPNSDPLTATLAAFGTYFIGFVGRLGLDRHGVVTHPRAARADCVMAAVRRTGGPLPGEPGRAGLQRAVRRRVRHLGLAGAVHAVDRAGWHRVVDPPRHPRDARVPTTGAQQPGREGADHRRHQAAAQAD